MRFNLTKEELLTSLALSVEVPPAHKTNCFDSHQIIKSFGRNATKRFIYLEMQEKKEVITLSIRSTSDWIQYYKNVGIPQNLINRYEPYIGNLIKKGIPVIFEINHLALLLGVNKDYLLKIINGQESFYREFTIKKKSGGERIISAPYPSLLMIQKWIYENILKVLSFHKCAHGYSPKKSIVSNCKVHISSNEFLKLDLKDFFPSIGFNRIIVFFNKLGYSRKVSYYLARLCTLEGSLPQGAPTSPILSNLISIKLDKRLYAFAQKFRLKYTRYADDIVFSGDSLNIKLFDYIISILNEEGFNNNSKKTRYYKETNKKIITGISIQNRKLKLPRSYRRNLVLELNYIMKYGFDSHISKKKIRNLKYLQSIIGKVNFWLQVEPDNQFANKAKLFLLRELRNKLN